MRFDIISLFPESFSSYFSASILKRARDEKKIEIHVHNLRDYTHDKHRTVDDTPYGGGAGMVLKIEPLVEALETVQALPEAKGYGEVCTILFSAKGRTYTQKEAKRLSTYDRLILIAGRYEGVDERILEFVDEELSIGNYVLTGGEVPAMVVVDTVTRLLPGVLGNPSSAVLESHSEAGSLEYPQYTKPEVFRSLKVPDVLLSGHHAEIEKWRQEEAEKTSVKIRKNSNKNESDQEPGN